jgi:hypothetical protein
MTAGRTGPAPATAAGPARGRRRAGRPAYQLTGSGIPSL